MTTVGCVTGIFDCTSSNTSPSQIYSYAFAGCCFLACPLSRTQQLVPQLPGTHCGLILLMVELCVPYNKVMELFKLEEDCQQSQSIVCPGIS